MHQKRGDEIETLDENETGDYFFRWLQAKARRSGKRLALAFALCVVAIAFLETMMQWEYLPVVYLPVVLASVGVLLVGWYCAYTRERAVKQARQGIQEELRAIVGAETGKLYRLIEKSGSNVPRAHRRRLTNADLDKAQTVWGPRFGLNLTTSSVAYLAHKICLLEDSAEGRLATDITTAVLRIFALRSLKADQLDVLEIGSLFGIGAGILFRLRGPGTRVRLTLVDPLDGYYGKDQLDLVTGVPVSRSVLESNMRAMGLLAEDYRLVQKLSGDPEAVRECGTRSYDCVLLDGDHSYEGVAQDFRLYAPMVKPGGLLLFDDYGSPEWPEVTAFVDENVKGDPDWEWIGSDWRTAIVRKKGES